MVKRVIFLVSFLALNVSLVKASHNEDISQCNNADAVCVGKVLLNKLDQLDLKEPFKMEVEFYHDDWCNNNLIITMSFGDNSSLNEGRCRRFAKIVNEKVWGYKMKDGKCVNITDVDFLTACMLFI